MKSVTEQDESVAAGSADVGPGLLPYVSRYQAAWLADADPRRWREEDATLVFADVSGFTPLTERLARLGKVGAEALTDVLNDVFGGLLGEATRYGGDLLKFGGDALLLLYTGEGHEARACTAAAAMQAGLRPFRRFRTPGGWVSLRMSVGVQSGRLLLVHVGSSHRELLVAGPVASGVAELESAAEAGEILVSLATAACLPAGCLGAERDGGRLLRRSPSADPAARDAVPLDGNRAGEGLTPALREHLSRAPGDGEHRLAVLSFIQFKGSDVLLEAEGPDAMADALDEVVCAAQAACAEHDVTFLATDVDRDGGKLLLAAGAPVTLAGDADRMLLALRDVVGSPYRVSVRAGVNRGRVFAVDVGSVERRTYAVMGDPTNLAARVMGKAPPGALLATQAVLDALATRFELVPLEPFTVKGKSQPVHAQVVGPPLGRSRHHAAALPLVGREEEVSILRRAVAAVRAGRPAAVELVGEAGLGKSRLLAELVAMSEGLTTVTVEAGQYAVHSPYFAVRAPLRRLLALSDAVPDSIVEIALRAAVRDLAPGLEPLLPLIGVPFGLELPDTDASADVDPVFRRSRMHAATADLVGALLPGPAVVTIEDAHWLDEPSGDLLVRLLDRRPARPWLVCLTRREGETGLRLPLEVAPTTVRLQPLATEATTDLMRQALEDSPLPRHVLVELVERSGGNPLFVEELLVVARQTGGAGDLPDTVEAVIGARIDTLPPTDRALLRRISVLGGRIGRPLFDAMLAGDDVDAATAVARLDGFLHEDGTGTVRFRHALVRDVAYEALPYRRRRALHLRAGEIVERLAGDDLEEWADLLSLHYLPAQRYDKAWRFARLAADRARRNAAPVDAAALERALEAARRLPAVAAGDLAATQEMYGDVCELSGRYADAAEAYHDARRLLADDALAVVHLYKKEGWLRERSGRYAQALRWYTRAFNALDELARDGSPGCQDEVARARAELTMAYGAARVRQGRYRESIATLEEAVRRAEEAGDRATLAHTFYLLDWALTDLGEEEADRYRSLALPIYEELGDFAGQANVLNNLGVDAYYEGRWDEALEFYDRSRVARERAGDVVQAGTASNNIGEILSDQGHLEEAEALFKEALAIWRAASYPVGIGLAMSNLGRLASRAGRLDDAEGLLADARVHFTTIGAEAFVLETDARDAERLVFGGRPAAARELAESIVVRALRLGGQPVLLAMLDRVSGYAWAQQGDADMASGYLQSSLDRATAAGADFERALTHEAMARLGGADADRHTDQAAALLARLGVVQTPSVPLPSAVPPTWIS